MLNPAFRYTACYFFAAGRFHRSIPTTCLKLLIFDSNSPCSTGSVIPLSLLKLLSNRGRENVSLMSAPHEGKEALGRIHDISSRRSAHKQHGLILKDIQVDTGAPVENILECRRICIDSKNEFYVYVIPRSSQRII